MPAEPGESRPGSWSNRDFHDEVPRRRGVLERGATAGLVTFVAFVVFLVAIQHENDNCRDACFDGGLRTYERGHAWTAYQASWQWQAQWALGLGGLALGLAALATRTRYGLRRWTMALIAGACVLGLAWVAWRVLEPATPT